jgi:hypothetical protein
MHRLPLDFTCGRVHFSDHAPAHSEPTAKIYVPVKIGDRGATTYAQLDTGAAWSILDPDIARDLDVLEGSGLRVEIYTWLGKKEGRLVHLPVTFLAEEGEPLTVEGVFLVSRDWLPGRTFLGYTGLLDSVRTALDPQRNHFYFGSS